MLQIAKRRPSRARTWLTSPSAIIWRMRLEEMGAPRDGAGVDDDAEAKFAAECFEAFDACLRLIAETEIFAFVQFGDVEAVSEHLGGEGAGRDAGEFAGEGKDESGVDAGGCEKLEFLRRAA